MKDYWPILFLFVLTACFFWPTFLKGYLPFPGDLLVAHFAPWNFKPRFQVPHKAQGGDAIRMMYPWRALTVAMMKKGQWPLWNPYNFSGNPHLANFQSAVFYPLNVLFFIFPLDLAWTIYVILQPLLASILTFLFLKNLRIGSWGALLSAIAFGFSAFMTVWLLQGNFGHTILWLPLLFLSVDRLVRCPDFFNFSLSLFSFLLPLSAGHLQSSFYLYLVAVLYFLFRSRLLKRKKLPRVVFFFLFSLFFSLVLLAVQLLPTWELVRHSARTPFPLDLLCQSLFLKPYHLIGLLSPDFFGNPATRNYYLSGTYVERVVFVGLVPLIFALFLLLRGKRGVVFFFTCLSFFSLLFCLDTPLLRLFYRLKPPFLSALVPTRNLFILSFSLAVLGGIGLDQWLGDGERERRQLGRAVLKIGFLLFLLWLFVFSPFFPKFFGRENVRVAGRNLVLPTAVFLTTAFFIALAQERRKIYPLLFILLTIIELFYLFRKFTPFSPREFVFPEIEVFRFLRSRKDAGRFWGYGTAYVDSNFATYFGLFSPDGYDALYIARYGELLATSRKGRLPAFPPRSDANIAPGFGIEDLRKNPFRQKLLNLLGVKYILHQRKEKKPDWQVFPKEKFQLIWQREDLQIYENKEVLARAFLASDYLVLRKKEEIINALFSRIDPEKTLVLEEDPQVDLKCSPRGIENAQIVEYSPNRVEIETFSLCPRLLFLSDNFYPGWKAFVDGKRERILRANYSFRAVVVPRGRHRVVFLYQPDTFLWGMRVSLVSLLFFLFSVVVSRFSLFVPARLRS